MYAKMFRYVIQTPGVAPLAGFDDKHRAEAFVAATQHTSDYNMELVIVDQYEAMQKEEARRKRVARILDAVRVLKEVA